MKSNAWKSSITSIPVLCVLAWLPGAPAIAGQQRGDRDACNPNGGLTRITGVSEASGLALSRRTPGRLWSINDSGEPVLFALNARGEVTARVRLTGAVVDDWEAVAVGPCPEGSCVYIGDIGDNQASRRQITVYRVPEPSQQESAAVTDVFHAVYPDGPQDAEALLVTHDGAMLVVTKGETGPIAIYRFPRILKAGATATLERLGTAAARAERASRVTDGTVSPDGQWVVLRTGSGLSFHRTSDLLLGQWREVRRVSLVRLREPQGEGVALADGNVIFVAGEGGGQGLAGTLAQLTCAPAAAR